MSFDHLFIRDVEGERRIDATALPLRVGTGSDCQIRLPGPGGGPVILLDLLDGVPFVQPVGRDVSMAINGEPLATSRRLDNGDELQYFGSRIRVVVSDERLDLHILLEDSAYVTKPPVEEDIDAQSGDEAIAPKAFRRAADTRAVVTESRHNTLKIIIGSGLGTALLIAYLLFSSRSIDFEVLPVEPDSLEISGGWFELPLGDRVLLRKGDYTVNVSKDGYYDVNQNFTVGDEPSKTVRIEMRKRPGMLTVAAMIDDDATVAIDSTQIGPSPFGPVELQPGEHSVVVHSARYLPYEDTVFIEGLGREDTLNVQLVPRWANVSITTEPPGATIFAGEQQVGTTPVSVEFLEGGHQISVVLDGYAAWDGNIVAEANVDQGLPLIQLQPANAKLLVNSIPRSANVTVNGRYRGQSPITLDLAPNVDYVVGLSKAGYGSTSRQVRLGAAASDSITVDLSARTGSLTVNVSPADATVYVDGRARGNGSTTLKLSSAPHRVAVRKDGYESWSRTITPRPGYPQTVSVSLRSEAAIAAAAIAREVTTAEGQTLRRVEPGTFVMGSSRSEQGRRANEVLVPTKISRAYYIGVHEITNREYAAFKTGHDSGSDIHASMAGDNNPVANVTWANAAQYCNWLSAKEGLTPAYKEEFGEWVVVRPLTDGYRLPTEAEWAWALRYQGTAKAAKFSWGDAWPPPEDSGNFADRSAVDLVPSILPRFDDGFASTAPVGRFPPNALGIRDGAGNVAEWVNDYYTVPAPGQTSPIIDPLGPERGSTRVIRGSSWRHSSMTELRMSFRGYGEARRMDVGFRIARTAD